MTPPSPSSTPNDKAARLEKYLDHLLGPESAQAQREIDADPRLHQEVELQHWIDSELDEMFAYDSSRAPVIPHAEEAAPIPFVKTRGTRFRPLAMAAALLLAGIGVWIAVNQLRPVTPEVRYVAAQAVYDKLNAGGFKPDFVCTTDEEFKAATKKQFGSPLLLASAPGITPLGWAYNAGFRGKIVGDRTMMLLTKVDDKNVLVLMDTTDRPAAHPIELPSGAGLHVFRRQVGPVVNYEITPFDTERVIGQLREP